MDVLGEFIAECCIVAESVKVKAKALYDAYSRWIGDNGVSMPRFGVAITERGFAKVKNNGVWYEGIALLTDADKPRA